MMQLLTRNAGWKIVSLLIAFALWIAIAREPELATSLSVPIQFKNIPDDLDIGSNVPDRIHVEVRGPAGRLSRDNLSDLAVVLDLSGAHVGERTYTVHQYNTNLPAGVVFDRALPSQITLRFDRVLTREVPVVPIYSKTPEGYRVRAYQLEPERVRIRGPEERVKGIARVGTDPVDLTGVVSQKEFHTAIKLGDPQVRLEVPNTITLKVTLEKSNQKDLY